MAHGTGDGNGDDDSNGDGDGDDDDDDDDGCAAMRGGQAHAWHLAQCSSCCRLRPCPFFSHCV